MNESINKFVSTDPCVPCFFFFISPYGERGDGDEQQSHCQDSNLSIETGCFYPLSSGLSDGLEAGNRV